MASTAITGYPGMSVVVSLSAGNPGSINGGSVKRYSAAVTSGAQYVVSLTNVAGEADLHVYNADNTFSTMAACPNTVQAGTAPEDCVVTATSGMLYFTVQNPGAAANSYRVRVAPKNTAAAAAEGAIATPVTLNVGVPYPGTVATLSGASSYYTVTAAGTTSITVTGLQAPQDIDMKIYSGADFATGPQTCAYAPVAGVAPEECGLAAGTWYIQVINNTAGGPFVLSAD